MIEKSVSRKEAQKYYLGLDIGSVSVKSAILDKDGGIVHTTYAPASGRPITALQDFFEDIRLHLGELDLSGICLTGSGKKLISAALRAPVINEIVAHARSCWSMHPGVCSIIEIGGQDSKFIEIGERPDGRFFILRHAFNGLCSAGTGAFLDQQSQRLGLSIEDFSLQAYEAASVPPIAGRCSVFAKSDMIHLQQKGVQTCAIAAGLCHALARNYVSTLCKGRTPQAPVVFQGGVAANAGMRRAFCSVLDIPEQDLFIPGHHKVMGAIGAAQYAFENPLEKPYTPSGILSALAAIETKDVAATRAPLVKPRQGNHCWASDAHALQAYLGLDVGSVTTKAVLMADNGALIGSAFTPTRSEPVNATFEVLRMLRGKIKNVPKIKGCYVTGSGRYLVRDIFGGDGCIDEISAQARAARELAGEVDTIFEIGGQDSKFIRLQGAYIKDFVMNRMCAAGTGSFLAEQAQRLEVNIEDDFAASAFQAVAPVDLGARCTVFMDSDLVHHIQQGKSGSDLCAGLAYSIAQNYLDNVVGKQPIGKHIVFQGGVANNGAVHAAFEALTGKEVMIHPHPTLSGALGAALYAREELQSESVSGFIGFDARPDAHSLRRFTCEGCENACNITVARGPGGNQSYFGSICGKYEIAAGNTGRTTTESLFAKRQELLRADYLPTDKRAKHQRGVIGLPYALGMLEHLPFWKTFFQSLGFETVVSEPTTRVIADLGTQNIPVETCMPVKILYGHVLHLWRQGVSRIFIPHTDKLCAAGESDPQFLCPYTQAAGYIIRSKIEAQTIILSNPDESDEAGWVYAASRELEISRASVRRALQYARAAQSQYQERALAEGKRILDQADLQAKRPVVLIGRPYHFGDRYLTMDLTRHLERQGALPIPMDFLDLSATEVPAFFGDLHWYMGRQALKAAEAVRRDNRLACVITTNFGCGPDAFHTQYLEAILENSPHLILEFDEHRAETGMLTRIEAFLRNLQTERLQARNTSIAVHEPPRGKDRPLKAYRYYLERFSDHAYAYVGALRACGCDVELLPPTDQESLRLGRRYAGGNECHPYHSILGDLMRLVMQPGFDPDGAVYYVPWYDGPCLMNQYGNAMRMVLERQGAGAVTLLNLGDVNVMHELFPLYPYYLARASYAIDRLFKWATEITPYEINPGEVRHVHQQNLGMLVERMRQHRLDAGIREAVANMRRIELASRRDLPVIGIAGDIFTRLNPQANDGLYEHLQSMGFEVWASAMIMDVVLLGLEQQYRDLLDKGHHLKGFMAKGYVAASKLLRGSVDRHFPAHIRTPQESYFSGLHARVSPYIHHKVDRFITLNINRIGEFHDAGANGVFNIMCPCCMVGTVSEAFFPELRSRHDNLPIESLAYGEQQSTHIHNRIEAFVHLLRDIHQEERASV